MRYPPAAICSIASAALSMTASRSASQRTRAVPTKSKPSSWTRGGRCDRPLSGGHARPRERTPSRRPRHGPDGAPDVGDARGRVGGRRLHLQPPFLDRIYDAQWVLSGAPMAFAPYRLRNPDGREQAARYTEESRLGESDQWAGVAYDRSHAERSSVSPLVVSSRRTISIPRPPRWSMKSLTERPLMLAALPRETVPAW